MLTPLSGLWLVATDFPKVGGVQRPLIQNTQLRKALILVIFKDNQVLWDNTTKQVRRPRANWVAQVSAKKSNKPGGGTRKQELWGLTGNWGYLFWSKGGWGQISLLSTTTWKEATTRRMSVSFLKWQVIGWKSHKLHQGRLRWDIKKNFSMDRVVKHWNRLPMEVLGSPSVEVFRRCMNRALRDVV